jgi:replicative DNA helicase
MLDGVRIPCSVESEQALIGAVLLQNSNLERVPSAFAAASFHDPVHARMWETIKQRVESGKVVTPITLKALMSEDPGFHEIGGGGYISALVSVASTPNAVKDCAETIMEMAERRRVMDICTEGLATASRPDTDFREALAQLEASLLATEAKGPDEAQWMADVARLARLDISEAARNGVSLAGISTGIQPLDDIIGGLKPKKMVVLAGRSSMGKTAAALWMAKSAAQAGVGVYFVSREMGADELSQRMISAVSAQMGEPVAYSDMQHPDRLTERELAAITRAALQLEGIPIAVAPSHVRSVGRIMTDVRRARRKLEARGKPLGLIVVDYLQLLHSDSGRRENRTVEVSEISAALKALAMELGVPVLALSQLSRKVEERDDKRPQLSDLRESGSIEQDADTVIFVFREEYYIERMQPEPGSPEHVEWRQRLQESRGKVDFIVGKNRGGPVETAKAFVQISTNSFT